MQHHEMLIIFALLIFAFGLFSRLADGDLAEKSRKMTGFGRTPLPK